MGHHCLWRREKILGVWFCAGQRPLSILLRKGCSSSKCDPKAFSVTLGDKHTFGYGYQCCQAEGCNKADFQGEDQLSSVLSLSSCSYSQSIDFSLCLLRTSPQSIFLLLRYPLTLLANCLSFFLWSITDRHQSLSARETE